MSLRTEVSLLPGSQLLGYTNSLVHVQGSIHQQMIIASLLERCATLSSTNLMVAWPVA